MSVTVTTPTGTFTPVLWMEYASTTQQSHRVYESPGQPAVVVYGTQQRARAVTLSLLFKSEDESRACELAHAVAGVCMISDPDRLTHAMRYVAAGQVTRTLDPETADVWIVQIDAMEVPA